MNEAEKRRVARLVAGIVLVDDDLDPIEDLFIDKMLAGFGIPDSERAILFPIVDRAEASEEFARLAPDVQEEALAALVEAAAADGQIVDEERSFLSAMAAVAGWSEDKLVARCDAALARAPGHDG
jgi:hypothetical protein